MKMKYHPSPVLSSVMLAGGLLLAAPAAHAQATDLVISKFDTADDTLGWTRWWGAAPQTYEFDPAVDAANDANSGSLKATIEFDKDAYTGDNQFAVQGNFPDQSTVDGTQYRALAFDLQWDPNSPQRSYGDLGSLEFGFRTADYKQIWLTPTSPITIPATTEGWMHVVAPIDKTAAGLDQINGVVLKMWSGDPTAGQTGTATFWLDNVQLLADTNTVVQPPTLSLQKAEPGLQLIASAAGAQYQRQNIRTVNPSYSWVGASQPVTYAVDVENYPDTNHTGFQTHIFLLPGDSLAASQSAPDYSEPDIVFLDIQNNNSGGAYATLRYKVDQPNGNTMIYNSDPANGPVGALGGVGSATPNGRWSMTFNGDTSVLLTSPDGSTNTVELPSEAAAHFAGPLRAYFGIQPNQPGNINQSARFKSVEILGGVQTPISENFHGVTNETQTVPDLDPEIWERSAQDSAGIIVVPPSATWWATWTVPAQGYKFQESSTLAPGSWTDVPAPAAQVGGVVRSLIGPDSVPDSNHAFFRLVKPPAEQP